MKKKRITNCDDNNIFYCYFFYKNKFEIKKVFTDKNNFFLSYWQISWLNHKNVYNYLATRPMIDKVADTPKLVVLGILGIYLEVVQKNKGGQHGKSYNKS
ncbi:hypothetical protein [Mycoplasma marinum]|nr:hypothetical protein [Mycoplasma marinum]